MTLRKLAIAAVSHEATTARYFERAARLLNFELLQISLPEDLQQLTADDLLLVVDPWYLATEELAKLPCSTAGYLIDVHLNLKKRKMFARYVDHVFVAQKDAVAEIAALPHPSVHWLPLACDPGVHFAEGQARDIDVAFVGKFGQFLTARRRVLKNVLSAFNTNPPGYYAPNEMGKLYSRAKIVFNKSIRHDVNMRVFEALGSGALLVTDRIGNGFSDLFKEDEHYIGYGSIAEAKEKISHYLAHDKEREKIALAGHKLAIEKHTYRDRLKFIIDTAGRGKMQAPARVADSSTLSSWRRAWNDPVRRFYERIMGR